MCFHTLLQQGKFALDLQKWRRKNMEEKIFHSCLFFLNNKMPKRNLSFLLPMRARLGLGEGRAVPTPSQAWCSYCSCSAQWPKYQGLLEPPSVQGSAAAELKEGQLVPGRMCQTPWHCPPWTPQQCPLYTPQRGAGAESTSLLAKRG